ncbi:6671_t:CDS:2 [Ambispora leptoticha]|uniref:6671_t:CDS:1 n=1 Tax=Ambispora leptoticha TaxID=144679 RepID=A0A9N9H0H8_9GLOM|nr:6671_t:CDS:2 [Ambispora leptoticha]
MATETEIQSDGQWVFEKGFQNNPETPEPIELQVKGTIPKWAEGVLHRNGPGTFEIPIEKNRCMFKIHHWFDGLAQVHRFEIRDGKVTYRSRNISKVSDIITFGQDPCESLFHKFSTSFQVITGAKGISQNTDANTNANTNVTLTRELPLPENQRALMSAKTHRQLVAQTDANILKTLDPITIEPIKVFNFSEYDPRLNGEMSPAHPQYDASTGEYISFTQKNGPKTKYTIFSIREDPETRKPITKILYKIKASRSVYVHSFSLTKKYVILILWQCDLAWKGLKVVWNKNLLQSFKPWNHNESTYYYVIDRDKQNHVATFISPTYFCFHTLNAWDENDDIILDLVQHKDHSPVEDLALPALLGQIKTNETLALKGRLTRYRLAKVSENLWSVAAGEDAKKLPSAETLFQAPLELNTELTTIDYSRFHLKKHRFAYGANMSARPDARFFDTILKLDLDQNPDGSFSHKKWEQWSCTPSEPIFIPAPNAVEEDDGVVLSVVLDGTKGTSFLLVLDAKSFKEIARAEFEYGKVVPYGFHGVWKDEI